MLQQQQQQQPGAATGKGLPDVRLFFESPPELQDTSRLQGWAPWVGFAI